MTSKVIWSKLYTTLMTRCNRAPGVAYITHNKSLPFYSFYAKYCIIFEFFVNYSYNKLAREVREVAKKISELDASDSFRSECSARLLQKL